MYKQHLINVHRLIIPVLPSRHTKISNVTPVVDLLNKHCNVCDRSIQSRTCYQKHMSRHHHIKFSPAETFLKYVNRNKIPVIDKAGNHCTACDKVYSSRASYKGHSYAMHGIYISTQTGKNYSETDKHCASCNRTYSSPSNYKKHLNSARHMMTLKIKQEDTAEKLHI